MKARTLKRLAILIAILSFVGGTGFLTQRIQVERMAQKQIAKAELALKQHDFAKAQTLFREHLELFPDDLEIQIRYADALLKTSNSGNAKTEALQFYNNVLKRTPGREDVRRLRMQLKIDMGRFNSNSGQDDGADADLKILLEASPGDGSLLYLKGRCLEEKKDDSIVLKQAESMYQEAIKSNAPERIEAAERLATLLRINRPNHPPKPDEADQVINSLVETLPRDYRGYLARGRYLLALAARDESQKPLKLDAKKDFEKARELAPSEADVYLQLAQLAENNSKAGLDEARRILTTGLESASSSSAIYEALANIELRAGNRDEAIGVLDSGLKKYPDQSSLRLRLADLMAQRGDTGKLLLQIEELNKLGCPPVWIQYITACYCINQHQFVKARQILITLYAAISRTSEVKFKSRLNLLLARCYKELGEPEMQQNEYLKAVGANPQDLTTRLGWIETLVRQGDAAGAIKEYRAIASQVPQVRPILAQLLIEYNQRLPDPRRDWSEVNELINQVDETVKPVLRARMQFAKGDQAAALGILEKARTAALENLQKMRKQFLENQEGPRTQAQVASEQQIVREQIAIWITQAELMGLQNRVDDALALLEQARQQLGDRVDLRLEHAKLWAFKKGPLFQKVLMELSQDIESFSEADRKRLLNGLAIEFVRQQDLESASRLWKRLAEDDPTNIELRLNLVDLALQIADKDEIERIIKQIEEIEGKEGLQGRYCRVRYLIWQAQRETDKDKRQPIELRAHRLLDDLRSRRSDWSLIPLAAAQLAEEELAQGNLNEAEIKAKEDRIIGFYRQAINLGQRRLAIVRRVVQLLFKNGHGNDALELLGSIPVESRLAGDVGRQAAQFALENKDYQRAEQIARRAVEANPSDFQARVWLAHIIRQTSERQTEAVTVLRDAIALSPSDPNLWNALVTFLIITKQPAVEVEKAIREAEKNLPQAQAPIALALCCDKLGQVYNGSGNKAEMDRWNDEAEKWYEKAEAAQPQDLSIKHLLTEFFLRNRQFDNADAYLEKISKQVGDAKSGETAAWANRTRALVLASGADPAQKRKALTFFERDGKPVPAGQEGKTVNDPEDLRTLVQVLDLQKTVVHRKRAIEILENLTDRNLATFGDRFTLARHYEAIDDWPKAREKYHELNLGTRNLRDMETLNRRPVYLAQFAHSLLKHHKQGDEQDLIDAQALVDEIKQLQPGALEVLILQVKIHQAREEIDKAAELVQEFASRPNLPLQQLEVLADLAESMKRIELAEQLYRRRAAGSDEIRGKLLLAEFLARHAKQSEALDLCEPLWKNDREIERVAVTCIKILFGSGDNLHTSETAQIERVDGWFEQAIAQAKSQHRPPSKLIVGLGNLRERQRRYSEAEELYRSVANSDSDGISYNNLAWLAALVDLQIQRGSRIRQQSNRARAGSARVSRHPGCDLSRCRPAPTCSRRSPKSRHHRPIFVRQAVPSRAGIPGQW